MKKLSSKEIKKILFGVILTDGSAIDKRFSIYLKQESLIDNIKFVLDNISGIAKIHKMPVHDSRFNSDGFKLWTTNHIYFEKLNKIFYGSGRKAVNSYIAKRLDIESFAYAWMCDGYLDHQKNRKANKVQNHGWLCLEKYPEEELNLIVDRLKELGINSRLSKVIWGFGYRILITGTDLQRFIDQIYPYILDDYKYKTELYYKDTNSKYILNDLSNTEHIIKTYDNCDDIVRHS